MKLVIVESPAKAKTIGKYLGKDYRVAASKGHVVDLPKSSLGIDVADNYQPDYVVTKKQALSKLKQQFKDADELILAVDQDREGEAIGWHIAQRLSVIDQRGKQKKGAKPYKRIAFTEITKDAVNKALSKPHEINMNLVDAQQARRVLDRLVGYKLSPLLWKKIRYGLSAGRVQSVALKLIVDKEREIEQFDPQEYWQIFAYANQKKASEAFAKKIVKDSDKDNFQAPQADIELSLTHDSDKKFEPVSKQEIEKVYENIKESSLEVDNIETRQTKRTPKPPFITSTLQQAAANRFGMSAKRTMKLAQDLYEQGHITYMRTDSFNISSQFIETLRSYVSKTYGKKNMVEKTRRFRSKSKLNQEAHEAIRPTNVARKPEDISLSPQHLKLYELIRNRVIATQMAAALIEKVTVVAYDSEKRYRFQAKGQTVKFPGYLQVYHDRVKEQELPEIKQGDILYMELLAALQKFTQPPARYNEASLIKTLEKFGIGRPSTYAPIISTLLARKYIDKEVKQLIPTDTGRVVIRLLEKNFPEIVDVDFTSRMEDQLDQVATGELGWQSLIDDFYQPFAENLEAKSESIKKEDYTVLGQSDTPCPVCTKPMQIKLGRYGKFLSCVDFPDCKGMASIDGKTDEDIASIPETDQFRKLYRSAPVTKDGEKYLFKRGRYGYFWAHPDYPKQKDAKPLELQPKIKKEIYGETPKSKDGKKMVLKKGRFGEFWAHPKYPKVKEVQKIDKKKVKENKAKFDLELKNI